MYVTVDIVRLFIKVYLTGCLTKIRVHEYFMSLIWLQGINNINPI